MIELNRTRSLPLASDELRDRPPGASLLCFLAARTPDGTSLCPMAAAVAIFAFLALFWTVPTAVFGKGARAAAHRPR